MPASGASRHSPRPSYFFDGAIQGQKCNTGYCVPSLASKPLVRAMLNIHRKNSAAPVRWTRLSETAIQFKKVFSKNWKQDGPQS